MHKQVGHKYIHITKCLCAHAAKNVKLSSVTTCYQYFVVAAANAAFLEVLGSPFLHNTISCMTTQPQEVGGEGTTGGGRLRTKEVGGEGTTGSGRSRGHRRWEVKGPQEVGDEGTTGGGR